MREFFQQTLQLLLDELGIDEKRQFMLLVLIGLVALVVYSVRDRHQHGLLITFLFAILGFCAVVFLFTDSEAARHWSALISGLAVVAILAWEFRLRDARRKGVGRRAPGDGDNAEPRGGLLARGSGGGGAAQRDNR